MVIKTSYLSTRVAGIGIKAVMSRPPVSYQGDGAFRFEDVTQSVGLTDSFYGMGVAVGDYDNDGDSDLYITAVGENRLYKNDNGTFLDVTKEAGVAGEEGLWGTSCGFVDFDNDGLLDLFVCNYVNWSKENDLSQSFTLDGETRAYGRLNICRIVFFVFTTWVTGSSKMSP